ncbi:MAG: deaminase [bacterium]
MTDFRALSVEISLLSKEKIKVGCVLVSDCGSLISTGFNYMDERLTPILSKGLIKKSIIHAEVAAIIDGCECSDLEMYVSTAPCFRCAMLALNVGIRKITCPSPDESYHWYYNQMLAKKTMEKLGIELDYY